MRIALVTGLLLMTLPAWAGEPPELAIRALASIDSFTGDGWSYTKTTTSKEGHRVERHDASRAPGERWTLVSIDGRAPTQSEREQYRRDKGEEVERRNEQRENDDPDIDHSSIRLVSETAGHASFSFRPQADGRLAEAMVRKINGTLLVNKDGGWTERFELRSTGEIKPIPGIRVEEFHLLLAFRRHSTGEIIPVRFESRVRGRAFLVKSLDQDRVSQFSDFVRVAE